MRITIYVRECDLEKLEKFLKSIEKYKIDFSFYTGMNHSFPVVAVQISYDDFWVLNDNK